MGGGGTCTLHSPNKSTRMYVQTDRHSCLSVHRLNKSNYDRTCVGTFGSIGACVLAMFASYLKLCRLPRRLPSRIICGSAPPPARGRV